MTDKPCLCCFCPHCRTSAGVDSYWALQQPLLKRFKRFWWASQFCQRCGSRWSAWHWLEQRTGLLWRRTYALAPGRLTACETAQLVALKRYFARNPEAVR